MPHHDVSVPVTIHEVGRRPGAFLHYFDQVINRAEAHNLTFRFVEGRMRRLDVNVLHVRDYLIDRPLGAGRVTPEERQEKLTEFLAELRKRRIRLVQTISQSQNVSEDSANRPGRDEIDAATSAWIVFDESTPTPDPERTVVIPLAHYRDRFLGYPRRKSIPGRVLLCVTPQSSTATARLLGVTRVTHIDDLNMRIVGEASPVLAADRNAVATSFRLEKLSDASLVQEVGEAELVVQPCLDSFEDWQTVLLALSLERAVLLPDTAAARHLADEVGTGWVQLSPAPLTAASIDTAITALRKTPPGSTPRLEQRDPMTVGDAYAEFFRNIVGAESSPKA